MKKNESFEATLAELDLLVQKLEDSDLSLDESIKAFEKAVGLVKTANEKLEEAEQKVRILTEGADGSITDKPFITDEYEA